MAKITREVENTILMMRLMGKSQHEIAASVGVTQSAISKRLQSNEGFRQAWLAASAKTGQGLLELIMLPKREESWEEDGVKITETYDPGARALEILKLKASVFLNNEETKEPEPVDYDLKAGWGNYESRQLPVKN